LEVALFRIAPKQPVVGAGVTNLDRERDKEKGDECNADTIMRPGRCVVASTPGQIYQMVKAKWSPSGTQGLLGHYVCDLLVLDEASQLSIPEAAMSALLLKPGGQLIVVGDHRQMAPIVQHAWDTEPRRTFKEYKTYRSLFVTLLEQETPPPMIKFAESFRLHAAMAEFLRQEIYAKDGIPFHSNQIGLLPALALTDPFVAAVLAPNYPLVVVVHNEAVSQTLNLFEQRLAAPVLEALSNPALFGLDARDGLGVVVPHRAQRAAMQARFPQLVELDRNTGAVTLSAVDTVKRFQGGERIAVLYSATESDPDYLLASGKFLYDPNRLTVAISRAKRKMVLVASRSIFALFSPDEEAFTNAQLWKNLLRRTCTVKLWAGEREGQGVEVWGNQE
jgi:superfamily I DNA and/or RNA helicase